MINLIDNWEKGGWMASLGSFILVVRVKAFGSEGAGTSSAACQLHQTESITIWTMSSKKKEADSNKVQHHISLKQFSVTKHVRAIDVLTDIYTVMQIQQGSTNSPLFDRCATKCVLVRV